MGSKPTPASHQPNKAEMDEVIAIDATPDEIAARVLRGGAQRREPPNRVNGRRYAVILLEAPSATVAPA